MRKLTKLLSALIVLVLATAFIGCSNPSSSDDSGTGGDNNPIIDPASLAAVFVNGSVTTIKFNTFQGAQSATFENNNGTFSVTSGAWSWRDDNNHEAGTRPGVKAVIQSGNDLIIKYGFGDSNSFDTILTFNKEDNSYSITGNTSYFEISDITALEVNGTDIKSTLTKK